MFFCGKWPPWVRKPIMFCKYKITFRRGRVSKSPLKLRYILSVVFNNRLQAECQFNNRLYFENILTKQGESSHRLSEITFLKGICFFLKLLINPARLHVHRKRAETRREEGIPTPFNLSGDI